MQLLQLLVMLIDANKVSAANSHGVTAVHVAAAAGQTAALQCLLAAAPGSAAAVDSEGRTPLYEAALHSHAATLAVFLEAAPATVSTATSGGDTPLMAAASAVWTQCGCCWPSPLKLPMLSIRAV